MQKILIPIEFERHATQILDAGLDIAKKYKSKVWLMHIEPEIQIVATEATQKIRDNRAETLKSERVFIQQLAKMMCEQGVDSKGMILEGNTAETLLEEIEKLEIDLVIIGHHREGRIKKIFELSTDTHIVEKAGVPVLTIPI